MALTATEFSLLELLVRSPQQVFDRNQLIAGIYGPNSALSGRRWTAICATCGPKRQHWDAMT